MGRHSGSLKQKLRKGLWSPEEDEKLYNHITSFGVGCWSSVPKLAGLQRCGKSCRLRWINYLRPDLKRGMFSQQEEDLIYSLHEVLGNRWAQIASQLPGRTDNEIKNFWNSCLKKKLIRQGIDPNTHKPLTDAEMMIRKTDDSCTDKSLFSSLEVPQPTSLPNLSTTSTSSSAEMECNLMSFQEMLMNNRQPLFDPLFLFDLQGNNVGPPCNSSFFNISAQQNLNSFGGATYEFNSSLPSLMHLDHHVMNMGDADFADSSSSRISACMVNNSETKEINNHMGENSSTFSTWENPENNKLESLFQQYQFSGIKDDEEEVKANNPWQHHEGQLQSQNGDDFSNYHHQLTSLSQDLSVGNLDVFNQL
ncbi:hypothetical protein LIER_00314 [Lithospermum erythrorhizon]|uniref:Uncharacterized protein n=1 Tax=Lithospermum erythrorhizon TaxID=34254 RepID=A0AAV3NLF1_LITER